MKKSIVQLSGPALATLRNAGGIVVISIVLSAVHYMGGDASMLVQAA